MSALNGSTVVPIKKTRIKERGGEGRGGEARRAVGSRFRDIHPGVTRRGGGGVLTVG